MRIQNSPADHRFRYRGHADDDQWTNGFPEWEHDGRTPRINAAAELTASDGIDRREPALLLGVEDAARLLGVGRTTMFELIGQGHIQTVRLGRRRLVTRAGLQRFVDELAS